MWGWSCDRSRCSKMDIEKERKARVLREERMHRAGGNWWMERERVSLKHSLPAWLITWQKANVALRHLLNHWLSWFLTNGQQQFLTWNLNRSQHLTSFHHVLKAVILCSTPLFNMLNLAWLKKHIILTWPHFFQVPNVSFWHREIFFHYFLSLHLMAK